MNLTSTRHLGGTITAGSSLSGTTYASHTIRAPHTFCWMQIAVFAQFPHVVSLADSRVQNRCNLLESTPGAGQPILDNIMLKFELFDDEAPRLCGNFRRLCCGESASRQRSVYCHQELLHSYRGTHFHKIIPSFAAQGGDLTMRVCHGGANHFSSAGRGWLPDESKRRRHNKAGMLSMANNGPNSNGSQFFITTSAENERAFNGRHVCIGQVVDGLKEFLAEVAPYGTVQGHPSRYAVVVDCGEGDPPTHTWMALTEPSIKMSEAQSSVPPAAEQETSVKKDYVAHDATSPSPPPPENGIAAAAAAMAVSADGVLPAFDGSFAASMSMTAPLKSSLRRVDKESSFPPKHVSYLL